MTNDNSSYGQILRSSAIIGGAQGACFLIGMVRTKLVAVLLGPSGFGLFGIYVAITGLVGMVSGLGINASGVREIADAHGAEDPERMARTVVILRRLCWITGIFGLLLVSTLAYPISLWAFGSGERADAVALLGVILLFTAVSGGQASLLQGTRRIGELAKLKVASALAGTVVAGLLYPMLGQEGIIPVLVVTAAVELGVSWWLSRKIHLAPVRVCWTEMGNDIRRFAGLGLAFMWTGVISSLGVFAIRATISGSMGLDANGIYQAAWTISGMFAGFILGAMGTDFFPRLTAVANDHTSFNRLINEQTEIGILLALPGLVLTMLFGPWIMHLFFSAKFKPSADLLQWFSLGVFGQVVSWPLAYSLLAKGAGLAYALVESFAAAVLVSSSVILLRWLGLWGGALALPLQYLAYTIVLLCLCRHRTGFLWSASTIRLLVPSTALIISAFLIRNLASSPLVIAASGTLGLVACLCSIRGLVSRLGTGHRLVSLAAKFPGTRLLFGLMRL